MYTPTVRGGKKMSVGMLCLGKHWNGLSYTYEYRRSDFDNLPVPAFRPGWPTWRGPRRQTPGSKSAPIRASELLHRGGEAGRAPGQGRAPRNIAAGIPIVSVSLGDAARFVVGGLSRKDPLNPMILRSGDVLVMGGPSRLRYHGVTRIQPGTAPEGTGPGRFNLTFRQF